MSTKHTSTNYKSNRLRDIWAANVSQLIHHNFMKNFCCSTSYCFSGFCRKMRNIKRLFFFQTYPATFYNGLRNLNLSLIYSQQKTHKVLKYHNSVDTKRSVKKWNNYRKGGLIMTHYDPIISHNEYKLYYQLHASWTRINKFQMI